MAFNDFLEKMKETSASAMDKAKDTTKRLATINDLKSKIRGYNNDKNKLFTQMGMDLYIAKKQKETIDDKIEMFVSQVDTLNIRIKDLKEKLALLDSDGTEIVDEGGSEVTAEEENEI
ncbi:MAG: hypothetical protein K2L07_08825 [Lachnospiraceae bacterium]|nr:hypothetical protein [Lachnospiraceae bacterium]